MKRGMINLFILLMLATVSFAQSAADGRNVMWESVNVRNMDLLDGPGGDAMRPDLSRIKFIRNQTGGHQRKYRIEDGSGKVWVAKLGSEARPETAAVRLLWAIGYKTEVNYLVPTLTIPGKGTFKNVRLEARPDNVERVGEWKWRDNPFSGTNELQGLKIMQIFMTNWDVLDLQNQILEVDGPNGTQRHYVISDLGATFGKYGNNNLPIIYRLGRKTGSPRHYNRTGFIKRTRNGRVEFAVKGKNRGIYKDITIEQARWLANRLSQLSDKQIGDAFRAANYSNAEVAIYVAAVKRKIGELREAAASNNLAAR